MQDSKKNRSTPRKADSENLQGSGVMNRMTECMDKQKAADLLDNLLGMVEDSQENDYDTALKMGIEALTHTQQVQRWIPCSERLPEEDYVLISKKTTKLSGSKWCVTTAIRVADPRSSKINWRDIGFGAIQDNEVLAWMPLPEPYKDGDTDG